MQTLPQVAALLTSISPQANQGSHLRDPGGEPMFVVRPVPVLKDRPQRIQI
jgi:hypothetical protein